MSGFFNISPYTPISFPQITFRLTRLPFLRVCTFHGLAGSFGGLVCYPGARLGRSWHASISIYRRKIQPNIKFHWGLGRSPFASLAHNLVQPNTLTWKSANTVYSSVFGARCGGGRWKSVNRWLSRWISVFYVNLTLNYQTTYVFVVCLFMQGLEKSTSPSYSWNKIPMSTLVPSIG